MSVDTLLTHTLSKHCILTIFQEITALTDEYIDATLRTSDASQGKWIVEDPDLEAIEQHL